MRFVTDFLWRSPLGLRINAQDTAGVAQTEDWVKMRGDQLAPRDGDYDIRITAELWETHYFDHVSLMVVDHPRGPSVRRRAVRARSAAAGRARDAPPPPVARACDDTGRDVTELVSRSDGRYLDTFERGVYQGVPSDHWVEVEIAETYPATSAWLVAHGWIYPTDSSINVAIGQAGIEPHGLSSKRRTTAAGSSAPDLGFPAGKNKTISSI